MKLKIYSGKQIKMNIKEQVWIPVILLIGFFLAFPVAELLMMGNWFGMNYTYDQLQILYENLWKDGFLRTGFAITVIAALLNSVSEFWYLYSSKKVDFYHSIPVKRSRMFFSRMFTGIIFFALTIFADGISYSMYWRNARVFQLTFNEAGILYVPDSFDLLSAGIFCYCTGDLYYW